MKDLANIFQRWFKDITLDTYSFQYNQLKYFCSVITEMEEIKVEEKYRLKLATYIKRAMT